MNRLGFYGKTTQRGDFVRFNLPQTFVNVWDDWLQSVMFTAQQTQAPSWQNHYDNARAFRFALSADIAGTDAWIGYAVPSQDKVGRRFPFCVVCSVAASELPISAISKNKPLIDTLADLTERILSETTALDDAKSELETLNNTLIGLNQAAGQHSSVVHAPAHRSEKNTFSLRSNCAIDQLTVDQATQLIDHTLKKTTFMHSVWQLEADATRQADTLLCTGLPCVDSGIALLAGLWPSAPDVNFAMSDQALNADDTNEILISAEDVSPEAADLSTSDSLSGDHQTADPVQTPEPLNLNDTVQMPSKSAAAQSSEHVDDEPAIDTENHWGENESDTLSTQDWTEFENAESVAEIEKEEVVVPVAEPLEFDDDSTTAPWEFEK